MHECIARLFHRSSHPAICLVPRCPSTKFGFDHSVVTVVRRKHCGLIVAQSPSDRNNDECQLTTFMPDPVDSSILTSVSSPPSSLTNGQELEDNLGSSCASSFVSSRPSWNVIFLPGRRRVLEHEALHGCHQWLQVRCKMHIFVLRALN